MIKRRRRHAANREREAAAFAGPAEEAPTAGSGAAPMLAVCLAAVVAAVYFNSLDGAFVFDDRTSIVENDALENLADVAARRPGPRYLLSLSLAVNRTLGGLDPIGYHVFNIAVHMAAALILFDLVRRILLLAPQSEQLGRVAAPLAFAAALLWAVHPLQTQSVTYVVQRCEALMGMFYLLFLYLVLRSTQSPRAWPWRLGALAALVGGLLCKEPMATAPLAALLLDRVYLARSWREIARRRGLFYGGIFAAAVPMAALVALRLGRGNPTQTVGFSLAFVSWNEYLASQPAAILQYLNLSLWPQTLCIDYGWMPIKSPAAILGSAATVLALLAGSVWLLVRSPRLGLLPVLFFLALVPTSSFLPIQDLCVEHRMYLPLAPLTTLVVVAGALLLQRFTSLAPWQQRRAIVVAAVLLGAPLAIRTFVRNADYNSPQTLWAATVKAAPENPRAWVALAEASPDIAASLKLAMFERAVALSERRGRWLAGTQSQWKLRCGDVNMQLGRIADARDDYRAALQHSVTKRQRVEAGMALGVTHSLLGEADLAEQRLREAIRLDPDKAHHWMVLAEHLTRAGNAAEARAAWREARRLAPDDPLIRTHATTQLSDGRAVAEGH